MRKFWMTAGVSVFVLAAACGQQGAEASADSAAAETQPAAAEAPAEAAAMEIDAPSGSYITDYKHRYITFHYMHQGYSRPYLRWRDWTGELDWNSEDPEASSISVTIDASSIDSGVDEFDGHLRSADFFDVENHPTITFESTSVERTGASTGKLTGDLTIKGNTKPVTLDVVFNKAQTNDDGTAKIGFSASGTVNRSDFGVDKYVPFVDDEVAVVIETEFVTPPAE